MAVALTLKQFLRLESIIIALLFIALVALLLNLFGVI